jgi:hypothetical protein
MSEKEELEERGRVTKEYAEVKARLDTLLSRRRRVGDELRELSAVFLQNASGREVDWDLLREPDALKQLLRDVDDTFTRKANLKATLRGWGLELTD